MKVMESKESAAGAGLPVVMLQEKFSYSIILNLFNVDEKDIFIDVNAEDNELGVYAGKKRKDLRSASFWIFGVPHDGLLKNMKVAYKGGGLQITVPRSKGPDLLVA